MKKLLAALSVFLLLVACTTTEALKDIPGLAGDTASLSTLVDALGAAELVDDLQADGPFTVFAPSNDAFAALLAAQDVADLDGLIAKLGATTVRDILLYHVVAGTSNAADLSDGDSLDTLLVGEAISVSVGETVTLNDGAATVTNTDIEASNGVVHIIDAVLLPPSLAGPGDIAAVAAATPELSTLVAALTAGGLVDDVQAEGPFTVFAPNNAAFAALLAAQEVADLNALITELGAEAVIGILQYHVVAGLQNAADLSDGDTLTTLQGEEISVGVSGSTVTLNGDITVVTPDVAASNGVIHIVDGVLLPPSLSGPAPVEVTVTLSGANEVPAITSPYDGTATVTLTGSTLTVSGSYSAGMIIAPPGAHIHGPATATENAGVLYAFEFDNSTYTFSGTFDLSEDEVGYFNDGLLYINLHTAANPTGELRGQITPPSP